MGEGAIGEEEEGRTSPKVRMTTPYMEDKLIHVTVFLGGLIITVGIK